jgi:hypothetical protein
VKKEIKPPHWGGKLKKTSFDVLDPLCPNLYA